MADVHSVQNLPTGDHRRVSISQVMEQADAVLEAAYAENWELVGERVSRWRLVVSSFFDRLNPELEQNLDKNTVNELIAVNERLIELVRQGRDSTAKQIKHFTLGRRAVSAYHADHR